MAAGKCGPYVMPGEAKHGISEVLGEWGLGDVLKRASSRRSQSGAQIEAASWRSAHASP